VTQPRHTERVTTPDTCAGDRPATGSESDSELATRLAGEAGHLLLELRRQLQEQGAPTWDLMDHGDAAGHRLIADELRAHRPDDAVLDEEGAEDPRRFEADRVWIIDPLDGTREYGEGRHDWAVHVALWDRDHFVAGAVALPSLDRVLATDPPPVLPAVDRERPRLVTSRSRAPYAAVVVANALDCEPVRLGSAGAKAMAVVLGEADIYLHDGGMYQWDSAAPAAVAMAAGLHVSRVDGSPLVYNERSEWLPDFLVCRKELSERVLDALWK
jgi:3'(2'), 5'-bisphosphate nucleotidase